MSEPNVIELKAPEVARSVLGERIQLRRLQPAQTEEEAQRLMAAINSLRAAAAADEHEVLFPTHVFVKGDTIVGYASIAMMPVVNFWADSHKLHAGESLKMIEQAEAVCSDKGVRTIVVPCAANSPFAQHMERLGFHKLGTTVLYKKNL